MSADQKIGVSPHRVGGYERVTGAQEYLADIPFEDLLHAKLVTLPVGRARIISVDKRAALAVPGVRLVVTADDLPQPVPRYGPQYQDRPVLAVGETKFHGEPVAAVAAESRDAAEEAARLVQVEYEELPGVYTVAQATADGAPLVREPELRPEDDPLRESNVLTTRVFGWGDLEAAEAEADVVIDRGYSFPMITHFAFEPHAFAAASDEATRQYLLLQNAAFLPMFREAARGRGELGDLHIDELATGGEPSERSVPEIFDGLAENRRRASTQLYQFLASGGDPQTVADHARRLVFLKGDDSHDYKFSSAALEDYRVLSGAWRNRYLAASSYQLRSGSEPTRDLVKRIQSAVTS